MSLVHRAHEMGNGAGPLLRHEDRVLQPRGTVYYRLSHIAFGLALATLVLAACTFDDSGLADKNACQRHSDCVDGLCVDGSCVNGPPREDAGETDSSGPGDLDGRDDSGTGDDAVASDVGDDSGSPDDCDDQPLNACGGCGPLSARPGDDCGICGRYSCSSDRTRVVCNEIPLNACGGCGELANEPGGACGECGNGRWTCAAGNLLCEGDSPGLCGECSGPAGAVEGGVCACTSVTQADPAVWSCGASGPDCADGGGLPDGIRALPASSDSATSPTLVSDYLQTDGDIDIFEIRVLDTASTDRLEPRVTFAAARAGQWVCLAWAYDDGRSWEPSCLDGGFAVTIDGVPGCCADDETALTQGFRMLRDGGFSDDALDVYSGEGNDNGYAWLIVSDEGSASSCGAYSAELRF